MSGSPAILGLVEKVTGEGGSDSEERRDTPSYKSTPKKVGKSPGKKVSPKAKYTKRADAPSKQAASKNVVSTAASKLSDVKKKEERPGGSLIVDVKPKQEPAQVHRPGVGTTDQKKKKP